MHIGNNLLTFYYTKSVVQYFLNTEDVKSRQISKAMTTDNNLDSRTSRKSFSGIFFLRIQQFEILFLRNKCKIFDR